MSSVNRWVNNRIEFDDALTGGDLGLGPYSRFGSTKFRGKPLAWRVAFRSVIVGESPNHFVKTQMLNRIPCLYFCCVMALVCSATVAEAQSSMKGVIYGGWGPPKSASEEFSLSVGYLYLSPTSPWEGGFDIAGEGTMIDGTYGSTTIERGISFNLTLGQGLRLGTKWQIGIAGLLGMRQTSSDCPSSYLGYACYADRAPDVSHGLNIGAVAHIAYRGLMLGARRTNVSTQALLGVTF